MIVKRKQVKFHVDYGAIVNALPAKDLEREDISRTDRVLQMWNKTELKSKSLYRITIRNPRSNKKCSVEFIVVDDHLISCGCQ